MLTQRGPVVVLRADEYDELRMVLASAPRAVTLTDLQKRLNLAIAYRDNHKEQQ